MSLIELNNAAVSLMQDGRSDSAVRILEAALHSLRLEIRKGASGRLLLASACSHSDHPTCDDTPHLCHLTHQDILTSQQQQGTESDVPHYSCQMSAPVSNQCCDPSCRCTNFIFLKALFVSADETSQYLIGSIIFYNSALINHINGIHRCNSKNLVCAKKLYLLALDFVKHHSRALGSKRALFVSLAVGNNLGELHWQESRDAVEAKKCFCLARETLRHIALLRQTESGSCSHKEYAFFALNVMIRLGTDMSLSAAA
jgi:hypothetical protein